MAECDPRSTYMALIAYRRYVRVCTKLSKVTIRIVGTSRSGGPHMAENRKEIVNCAHPEPARSRGLTRRVRYVSSFKRSSRCFNAASNCCLYRGCVAPSISLSTRLRVSSRLSRSRSLRICSSLARGRSRARLVASAASICDSTDLLSQPRAIVLILSRTHVVVRCTICETGRQLAGRPSTRSAAPVRTVSRPHFRVWCSHFARRLRGLDACVGTGYR